MWLFHCLGAVGEAATKDLAYQELDKAFSPS